MTASSTNLWEWPTTFIGRGVELAELERVVTDGARLATIVGPPGVGKTRLAVRIGRALLDRYPGGVWFCDLSEARNVSTICHQIGHLLGHELMGRADRELIDEVAGALAGPEQVLIVLDNVESALEAAHTCLASWATRSLSVQFVITSRERTAVPGERLLDLGGLSLDAPGESGISPAVALFCERAETVRGGSVPYDEADMKRIDYIVRALEGLPLAIELAAARVRVLGTEQIVEQLPRALDAFRQRRGRESRHTTLRAAINWSWRMLEDWEQRAVEQCSIFPGGFSAEAAEAVLDLGGFGDAPPILDIIQSLCDKSLLAYADADGQRRLRLYALVQEYAREALCERGGEAEIRRRHANYFADKAKEWARSLSKSGGSQARARLRLERANLLAAHEFLVEHTEDVSSLDRALAMLPGVEVAVVADQPLDRFRSLLSYTIARADAENASAELRARALLMRLRASFAQTDVDIRDAERAIELLGEDGDQALRGLAWYYTGFAWRYRGQIERARECFEQAAELMAGDPPSHLLPQALGEIALVNVELGCYEEAGEHVDRAFALATRAGRRASQWSALLNRAILHRAEGSFEQALATAERGLELAAEIGEHWREVIALYDLADTARQLGLIEKAESCLERSRVLNQKIRWPLEDAYRRASLAFLHEEKGESAAAVEEFAQACETFRAAGFVRDYALLLVHQAVSFACDGRIDQARRALSRGQEKLPGSALENALVGLCEAHIALAVAERAQRDGDLDAGERHRSDAEERMKRAWRSLGEGTPELHRPVPTSRVADLRLLRRRFDQRFGLNSAMSPVVLDMAAHELRHKETTLALRSRPAVRKMLYALCQPPGNTVSKSELARAVWRVEYDPKKHNGPLKANVRNLRNLLRGTGLEVDVAEGGYCLRAPEQFTIRGLPRGPR